MLVDWVVAVQSNQTSYYLLMWSVRLGGRDKNPDTARELAGLYSNDLLAAVLLIPANSL